MKNTITTSILFLCAVTALVAQSSDKSNSKFSMGLYAGINIPNLTDGSNNALTSNYSSRLGEVYGLTTSYALCSRFFLRVDAQYSSEGGKRNGMQPIDATSFNPSVPAGTFYYANFNNESILNYIEIPVMAKYVVPINRVTKFYTNLGPYVGFLLNAKQKTSGTSLIYMDNEGTMPLPVPPQSFDGTVSTTDSVNKVNFGITGGVGLTKKVCKGDFFADLRGAYGLTPVQKNSQDGNSHSGYLLIAFGYLIPL